MAALADELAMTRTDREALGAEIATLKANAANFEEQKRLLVEARQEMLKEFPWPRGKDEGGVQMSHNLG